MGLLLQTNAVTGTFPWVSLEKIKNQIVKKLVTSILIILCLSFNNLFLSYCSFTQISALCSIYNGASKISSEVGFSFLITES